MGRRSATGRWAVEQTKSVAWRMRDLLPEALGEVRSLGSGHLIEREREPVLVDGDRQEPAIRDEPLDVLEDRLAHSGDQRSDEHTSELQSLMRSSSAVFCLKKKNHEQFYQ